MFKNHTNRFGVACIWLDERMGTQRDITSPLKPPSHTSKHKKHTYACNQASIRTNNVCLKKQGSKQAGLCMQSGGKSGKQTGRQAGLSMFVVVLLLRQKRHTLLLPSKKKLTTNPLPITETLKQKKHNHCTHAQYTTRHETTTKEASSTTLYSTQNRDDDDGRR